jgi:ribosomal protein S18 acetylase RimI-like enzyme
MNIMDNDIIFKLADSEDKKELIKFFKFYNNEFFIKKRVENYIKYNYSVVAKKNKNIIGLLQFYIKENPNSGVAEFEEVFVDEDFRGQKIASKLLELSILHVKQIFIENNIKPRKIFLFVGKENFGARKLYEKYGFTCISEFNDLFQDHHKELFYCLDLK